MDLKSGRGLFFFYPLCFLPQTETIRGRVVKDPETDSKGEHKEKSTTTKKLRQISLCYPIELAFFVYLYYFLHYFTSFILLVFFISFPYV